MSKLTELINEARCVGETLNTQQGLNVSQVVEQLNHTFEETFYEVQAKVYMQPEHDHNPPHYILTCY